MPDETEKKKIAMTSDKFSLVKEDIVQSFITSGILESVSGRHNINTHFNDVFIVLFMFYSIVVTITITSSLSNSLCTD